MEYSKAMELKNSKRHPKINKKRYRSAFTTDQVNFLENEFQKCPYIDVESRKELANVVKIPERAIKIWFQNRRMKEKKYTEKETESNQPHTFVNDPLINLSNIKLDNDSHYHDSQISTSPNCNLQESISNTRNNFNERQKLNSLKLSANKESDLMPKKFDKEYVAQHLQDKCCNFSHNNLSSYNNYEDKSKVADLNCSITKNCLSPEIQTKNSVFSIKRLICDSNGAQGLHNNHMPKYIKQESSIRRHPTLNSNRKHPGALTNKRKSTSNTQDQPLKLNTKTIKKPVLSSDADVKDRMNIKNININCNCTCNCCRLRSHCDSNMSNYHMPYMLIVPSCNLGKNNN